MMTSLLDHPLISERYFFPRRDSPARPYWVNCEGARLACAYRETDPTAATLIHFHGNGEVVADYLGDFTDAFSSLGCNCFLAEFRGYGRSTGRPQLGKMLADVLPILEALRCPEERIILFGRSVGSLFAIQAAKHCPQVAGLILESAIADPLERLLLRVSPEELGTTYDACAAAITEALDIREILRPFTRPTLILHTRHDGLIDVSHAERLAQWCGGPVRLNILPRGNHNTIMFANQPDYFRIIGDFLSSLRR